MSRNSYNNITSDKDSISPVYLFYGPDEYSKNEAIKKIEIKIINPETKEFNYNLFHIPETSLDRIISSANSLPFMSAKRLVILKNAEKITAAQDEMLNEYAANPSLSTCLILVGGEKLPKRSVFNDIAKKYPAKNFRNIFDNELPGYIIEVFRTRKKRISYPVAEELADLSGKNLYDIRNEIEKIVLYVGENEEIRADAVRKCCGNIKENRIFELIDYIVRKDFKMCFHLLDLIYLEGEDEYGVLNMISANYKKYHKYHELLKEGVSEFSILAKLGITYYKDKFLTNARRYNIITTGIILKKILNTELKMKSGYGCKTEIERLVFDLCNLCR
ncbi:MAG: DNA polymerase III subunit delta [Elusimicrobia bacterium ADurb.Bin231]|nr:MAG: DNA polymerase III subunit delta [Elusimicrobia bacterium ADurb.Bin231]